MSHQDTDHIVKNARMLKGLFDQLFGSASDIRRHGNATRDGQWLAAIAVTCWGWTQIGTLGDRVGLACKVVGLAMGDKKTITRQGLMSSLKSIGEELIEVTTNTLFEHLDKLGDVKTRYGRSTFAVDGTKFAAPRTTANAAEFSANAKRPKRKRQYSNASNAAKASTVQVLTTVIWHVHSGLPLCWRTNPGHASEPGQAHHQCDYSI